MQKGIPSIRSKGIGGKTSKAIMPKGRISNTKNIENVDDENSYVEFQNVEGEMSIKKCQKYKTSKRKHRTEEMSNEKRRKSD